MQERAAETRRECVRGFSEFAQAFACVADQQLGGVKLGPEDQDIHVPQAVLLSF